VIETDPLQMARQPIGAASNIVAVLRLRANAWEAKKLLQLGDKSWMVSASVVESAAWMHGSFSQLTLWSRQRSSVSTN
jgi:hypothetical protein